MPCCWRSLPFALAGSVGPMPCCPRSPFSCDIEGARRSRHPAPTRTPAPGFAGLCPGKQARPRVVVYCQRVSPRCTTGRSERACLLCICGGIEPATAGAGAAGRRPGRCSRGAKRRAVQRNPVCIAQARNGSVFPSSTSAVGPNLSRRNRWKSQKKTTCVIDAGFRFC